MKRNLLYSCCAQNWTEEWKLNIEKLNNYADRFNGRKIVFIKTGEGLVDATEVEAKFVLGPATEFVRWPNDTTLREVSGFIEGFEKLESLDPNEVTFFAHTKGTSYSNLFTIAALRKWRNTMYKECLDNIARVEAALLKYACAGCFRVDCYVPPLPIDAKWHFSGTFFWVNHAKLFSHPDWRIVHKTRWGAEGYLGKLFPLEQSFCFFNGSRTYNPYAIECILKCRQCGFTLTATVRQNEPKKICKRCFKRTIDILQINE